MIRRTILAAFLAIMLTGCAEVLQVLESVSSAPLTEQEVADGLKEALITGAGNAAGVLSAEDGYYGNMALRILLPEEAQVVVDNIGRIPGGQRLVDDVVIRINRAAEDAAREAGPVFASAITGMTVNDAFGILRGNDNAATDYLRRTAGNELYILYKPKIEASTSKAIVGGVSTKESWERLTSTWNDFAVTTVGRLAGFNVVDTDLDHYLTMKALEGLFTKVEEEELKIRTDISARVTPLMRRVFGTLDNGQQAED